MRAPAHRIVFVLALSLVLAGPAAARVIDKHFHESFDVEPGAVLHLEHGDGDVTIEPWDRNVIDVEVTYRAEVATIGIGGDADFNVAFRQRGNTVRVIDRETGVGIVIGIHVEADEGDVVVRLAPGTSARFDLETDDGEIRLDLPGVDKPRRGAEKAAGLLGDGVGSIRVHTSEGDVTLRESP